MARQKQYSEEEAKARHKIAATKYYYKHKEKIQEKRRNRSQERKDKEQATAIAYYSKTENRIKALLMGARGNAVKYNREFTITEQDIVIPTHCPYLGIELTHTRGQGKLWTNSSIDRIDSTKGYIPGNVQVISKLANIMKSNATEEQLLAFANGVIKLHGKN